MSPPPTSVERRSDYYPEEVDVYHDAIEEIACELRVVIDSANELAPPKCHATQRGFILEIWEDPENPFGEPLYFAHPVIEFRTREGGKVNHPYLTFGGPDFSYNRTIQSDPQSKGVVVYWGDDLQVVYPPAAYPAEAVRMVKGETQKKQGRTGFLERIAHWPHRSANSPTRTAYMVHELARGGEVHDTKTREHTLSDMLDSMIGQIVAEGLFPTKVNAAHWLLAAIENSARSNVLEGTTQV